MPSPSSLSAMVTTSGSGIAVCSILPDFVSSFSSMSAPSSSLPVSDSASSDFLLFLLTCKKKKKKKGQITGRSIQTLF